MPEKKTLHSRNNIVYTQHVEQSPLQVPQSAECDELPDVSIRRPVDGKMKRTKDDTSVLRRSFGSAPIILLESKINIIFKGSKKRVDTEHASLSTNATKIEAIVRLGELNRTRKLSILTPNIYKQNFYTGCQIDEFKKIKQQISLWETSSRSQNWILAWILSFPKTKHTSLWKFMCTNENLINKRRKINFQKCYAEKHYEILFWNFLRFSSSWNSN